MKISKFIISTLICAAPFAMILPGEKAPSFTLKDQNGKSVSLSDYKGKTVVLEWFNHGCPFVRKHYDSRNMQRTQSLSNKKLNGEIVWLSISSSAEGKQGYLADASAAKMKLNDEGSKANHMLLDHEGTVGRAYGAKTTPQMVIIDKSGIVAYHGAIDSNPSANPADVADATNYVADAVNAIASSTKVAPSKTKPYGCSVKY